MARQQLQSARHPGPAGPLLPGRKNIHPDKSRIITGVCWTVHSVQLYRSHLLSNIRTHSSTWTDTCSTSLWSSPRSETRFIRWDNFTQVWTITVPKASSVSRQSKNVHSLFSAWFCDSVKRSNSFPYAHRLSLCLLHRHRWKGLVVQHHQGSSVFLHEYLWHHVRAWDQPPLPCSDEWQSSGWTSILPHWFTADQCTDFQLCR